MRIRIVMLFLLLGGWAQAQYGKLPSFEFGEISSRQFAGQVLILQFWCSESSACTSDIGSYGALLDRHREKGLAMLAFSFDKDRAAYEAWLAERSLPYPSVYARVGPAFEFARRITQQVGPIEGIPTTLLVDRDGSIVSRHDGRLNSTFKAQIEALLEKD